LSDLSRELEELGGADITAALEDVPTRAWLLDAEGTVLWQNKASEEGLGDRRGGKWAAMLTERSAQDAEAAWQRLVCSGEPAEITIEVVEPDGSTAKRDVSVAPLREGGSVVGVFGVGVPARAGAAPTTAGADLGLTERQREILQLLADGKSTEQIASELFLSKTTVRNHVARILGALGVHTRVQAIVVASRAGMIQIG
jgi:DNA-binding CsgD family transcriptional regulator